MTRVLSTRNNVICCTKSRVFNNVTTCIAVTEIKLEYFHSIIHQSTKWRFPFNSTFFFVAVIFLFFQFSISEMEFLVLGFLFVHPSIIYSYYVLFFFPFGIQWIVKTQIINGWDWNKGKSTQHYIRYIIWKRKHRTKY